MAGCCISKLDIQKEKMAEQEQLYGIWFDGAFRWARISPPEYLYKKYGHSGSALQVLFATLQEIEIWYSERCENDPQFGYDFSIRPADTLEKITQERRLKEEDQRRRKIHADKYL